jgi:hypothetical protein
MDQAEIKASPKLRIIFAVVAVIMLALWGWSLIPPIENWGNPNEDGFSYVPVFYATITCLPAGLYLLAGAIAGRGRHVARARTALFLGGGLLFLVVAFLIFQHIANANGGRLFGIQIGFRLEYHDDRGRALGHAARSRFSFSRTTPAILHRILSAV